MLLTKKKKKRSLAMRFARGLYATAMVLSAIIVGLYAAYKLAARRPDTAEPPSRVGAPIYTDDPNTDADESLGPQRKEDTWTFLLAAEDQVSGSTDTIMVCTYDTKNQQVGLVSIPRDTLVDRRVGPYHYHKLNAAYANGKTASASREGGIEELVGAVSELLGIPIDHYVFIDTRIFVELVDTVGGVDFNVPVYMNYDAPDQDLHIHFQPGMQHLTGQQALEVVRCRKNSDGPGEYPNNIYDAYPDADIGRTRTQQQMVKTIAKKVLSNPQKIRSYVEIFSQRVHTDLSLNNLLWFVQPALGFDMDDLVTATLPGSGNARKGKVTGLWQLDIEGSLDILNGCVNPYTTPITADMVKMVRGD